MADVSAKHLLDLGQWQKIQNLFAEIISANLWLIELSGNCLTTPSKVGISCSDFPPSQRNQETKHVDCVYKAFQKWRQEKEGDFRCPHHFSFFSLPIGTKQETVGVITVGPVLVGKREDEKTYRTLCEKSGLDFQMFMDRIREMRLFSYNGVRIVIDFLRELMQYLVRLAHQRRELEHLVPGFLAAQNGGEGVFSVTYSHLLANYLLDIASEVVRADSGSVLLVDKDEESFSIKSARGISPEILKKKRLPIRSGVAGWVVSQRKPVLIGPKVPVSVPKVRLKRPHIKCSIVVPLEFDEKALGVFCLNANSANRRFNQNNLLLLGQLGKLASVALSRVNQN